MSMSTSARVGATAVAAALVFGGLLVWVGGLNPAKGGYQLKIHFADAGGLLPGARVQLMGVQIGQVIELMPEGNRVVVTVEVSRPKTQILADSQFMIASKGIVGDKVLEIIPPREVPETPVYIDPKDSLTGQTAPSLTAVAEEAGAILKKVRTVVDDPEMAGKARNFVNNMDMASKELAVLMKQVNTISADLGKLTRQTNTLLGQVSAVTADNAQDIRRIVKNINQISTEVEGITGTINELVSGNENKERLRTTLKRVSDLAATTGEIAESVQQLTNDPNFNHDVKELVTNAREAAQNAKILTKSLLIRPNTFQDSGFKVNFRTELLGTLSQKQLFLLNSRLHGNVNILGNMGFGPLPYFRMGIDDVGERNLKNFQLGFHPSDETTMRFGLIRDKLGLGTDIRVLNGQTILSGEAYDIVTPHMRLGLQQNIFGDMGLSFYWDNNFLEGTHEFNLGIRWEPHN